MKRTIVGWLIGGIAGVLLGVFIATVLFSDNMFVGPAMLIFGIAGVIVGSLAGTVVANRKRRDDSP